MSGMLRSAGENQDWKELMKLVYGERGQEGW